jgi:hypothetical protein
MKKQRLRVGDLVRIVWRDHLQPADGWEGLLGLDDLTGMKVTSVGWLIDYNKKGYRIVGDHTDPKEPLLVNRVLDIMRACVMETKILQKGHKEKSGRAPSGSPQKNLHNIASAAKTKRGR